MSTDPIKNPRDEEFMKRLQEEQSEADDSDEFTDTHADDIQIEDEPDTSPENT
jgi:hypothetical protein